MPTRFAISRIRFLISDWYQYGFRPPPERAGKDPVARRIVLGVSDPGAERPRKKRIERNWFLRRFRFARPDNLQDDRARDADLVFC